MTTMKTRPFFPLAQWLAGALAALSFAIAFWAIDRLPAKAIVATHWDVAGRPDLYAGKWFGFLFIPLLAALLWVSLCNADRFDDENGIGKIPREIRVAATVFVLLVQVVAEAGLACDALHIGAWPFKMG